jgi:hypothetical protein
MKKFIITAFVLMISCSPAADSKLKDLPPDREYKINILNVTDRRLPALSEKDFGEMLDKLKGYIREYLGYRVSFHLLPGVDMEKFRKDMDYVNKLDKMKELKKALLGLNNSDDLKRLREYIGGYVEKADEKLLRGYVPNYRRFKNRAGLSDFLYGQYVQKIREIYSIKTSDGSALNSGVYEETLTYPFWDMTLQSIEGPHFIFTNTIMADLEVDIPLYVILRYGITTGMVEGTKQNDYSGAGVMLLYPFISNDKFFLRERKEKIPPGLLTDVIALYSAHEFGHLLNHYKDYYDHSNCIFVPANDLNYYRWYRERKSKKCGLAHDKLVNF